MYLWEEGTIQTEAIESSRLALQQRRICEALHTWKQHVRTIDSLLISLQEEMHRYLTPELGEKNKHPLIHSQWRGRVDDVHKNTTKCFLLLIQMHWKLINTRDAKWTGDHTHKSLFCINHFASVSSVRIYTIAKPHVGVNKSTENARSPALSFRGGVSLPAQVNRQTANNLPTNIIFHLSTASILWLCRRYSADERSWQLTKLDQYGLISVSWRREREIERRSVGQLERQVWSNSVVLHLVV